MSRGEMRSVAAQTLSAHVNLGADPDRIHSRLQAMEMPLQGWEVLLGLDLPEVVFLAMKARCGIGKVRRIQGNVDLGTDEAL
eukprot:5926180-Amphidinium_carterae.2